MKHLEYYDVNNFKLKDVKIPRCKKDDVLIKVFSVGLCGSDIQKFLKQKPVDGYLKTSVLGHEIYGFVDSFGSNVKHLTKGQSVVVNPFLCPDKCKCDCTNFGLCDKVDIVGRTIDGGYSEYVCINKNSVYNANGLTYKKGIFIDDVAVALHGIHFAKGIEKEIKNIAVIGDGPLGLLVYRASKVMIKNCNVMLFSKNTDKLKRLKDIKHTSIEDERKNNKFDVVFEAVGGSQSKTLELAISLAKPNGFIGVFGVFPFMFKPEINIRSAFYKQLTIKGFNSYCKEERDFEKALKLVKNEKIQVEDLVTNVVKFNDIEKFLNTYLNYKSKKIKVVFTID